MATAAVSQGLLTFAFTDVVGSTRLWERVPEAARRALARHYDLVRTAVAANHGSIFKTVGDGCCCVFDDPNDAVRASLAIQRSLHDEPWPSEVGELQVRIGIHTGAAHAENGDYFGPTLNRVARLMSAAHGGQVVLSAATAELVRDAVCEEGGLIDLGAHRLKDLAEPQHIYQLGAVGLAAEFPPPATLDAHPNNLPSQLSTFIGRLEECARLRWLLASNRLVTICGLGGVGKTRLAIQIAADTIGSYADGAWIVRLADISDPALVAHAVASALHVKPLPGEAIVQTLCEQLRHRSMLLVLDNAEHLLPAAAEMARALLSSCPNLTIVATSREPLHLTGEQIVRIGRMVAEDATSLFLSRANLDAGDRYVSHICDELDGLPLAIEIAAGRIGTLTTKQLDARLNSMLPLLVSKDASQEARHQTLQATIEWSYRLLNPKEQRFFALLSVFEGGFTLEACEAVAWAGEEDDPAYELLDALVDKSFVWAEPDGDSMRYRLLEVLHRFAASKLEESGEAELAHQLHFAYFKGLADQWGSWRSPEEEHAFLEAFAPELPNVRSALDWGMDRQNPLPAFELLLKAGLYWQLHCSIAEARSWLARACAKAGPQPTAIHAKMLRRASTFATIEDDYAAARRLAQDAMEMFQALNDLPGTAEALFNLAVIEQRSGSEDEAYRLYAEALRIFEQTGHEIGVITALFNLALACKLRGDLPAAKMYLDRGTSLCEAAEHADRLATFLKLRGEVAMEDGAFDEAAAVLERSLAMKRHLQSRLDEAEVLCSIAELHLLRGDLKQAAGYAGESMHLARELEVPSLVIGCFEVFSVIFDKSGDEHRAQDVLSIAKAMRRKYAYSFDIMAGLRAELAHISDVAPANDVSPGHIKRAIEGLLSQVF